MRAMGHLEEAAEKRCAAADLVRLTPGAQQIAQLRALLDHGPLEGRPGRGRVALASGRRVVPGELGQRFVEHQTVYGAHEPQRKRGRPRLVIEAFEHLPNRTAELEV